MTPIAQATAYRLPELSRAVWRAVPEAAAGPVAAVTALGGASFLLVALSVLYWVGDRRGTLTVVGYALVALAVVLALKAGIGLDRPPASVRLRPVEADHYGFPSGHAVAAVVVYGGLASVRDRLSDRRVLAGVGLIVALVAASRVALGVHYLGDVLVGVALGVAILVVCRRVADDPLRAFAFATVLSVPAVVVTGAGPESLLALGGSAGGTVAAAVRDRVPALRSRVEGLLVVALGVPFVLFGDLVAEAAPAAPLTAAAYAGLVAGIVLLPAAVGRIPLPERAGATA